MRTITRFFAAITPLACLSILLSVSASAQAVYEPITSDIYAFLTRMEARQLLVNYRSAAKPLSRMELARQLRALDSVATRMTAVERDTYEFYKEEFRYELLKLAGDPEPTEERWHLFSTDLTKGIMNIDFDYALGRTKVDTARDDIRSQGFKLSGYVFDDVGYYFNYVDNRETGNNLDSKKLNTPTPGIIPTRQYPGVLEYDQADVQFSFRIGKFDLSLEKNKNIWGFGRNGDVIFSDKAPSYPQFKLRVPLADWLDFIYFHAELNSDVLDTVLSYPAGTSAIYNFYRPVYHSKYLVAHQLEFTVAKGVNLSIGESAVYSDRGIALIYCIPVMFFKAAEHYNGDTDNDQIFGSWDLNVIPNVNLYGSLFIDEIDTDELFNPAQQRNQIAYTFGMQTYDLLLENLEFLFEWSHLNPWVYSHKYPASTFTNSSYDLGDWVGQNGEDTYIALSYAPMRELRFAAFREVFLKGGKKDVAYQYMLPSQAWLYGPLHQERSWGLSGRYQLVRDLFADVSVRRLTIKDEADPSLNRDNQWEWSVTGTLGIW